MVIERMRLTIDDHRVAVFGSRASRPPTVWEQLIVEHRIAGASPEERLLHAIRLTERTCPVSVMLGCAARLSTGLVMIRQVQETETRRLRQRILRPHQALQEMWMPGQDHPAAGFYAATAANRVVAVGAILPSPKPPDPGALQSLDDAAGRDDLWRVRGMATEPERRGHGLGSMVLDALVRHARRAGARGVWASVRLPARSLYRRAGFVEISDVYEPEHIGPHVQMATDLD